MREQGHKWPLLSHQTRQHCSLYLHEQMQVYKLDAAAVEPMCWVMQLSSLPRADPPMPSHTFWAQCLGRCKGRTSFIQREKLLLLSMNCVGEVSRAIVMDPPQMGTLPSAQCSPGSAQAIA